MNAELVTLKANRDAAIETFKTSTTDPTRFQADKKARDDANAAYDAKVLEIKTNSDNIKNLSNSVTGAAFLESEYKRLKKDREDFTTNLKTAVGDQIDVNDFAFDATAGKKPELKEKGGKVVKN